jgi:hypothetical protein
VADRPPRSSFPGKEKEAMTTKNPQKKLRTSKDTLRKLTSDLSVVVGGTNDRCPPGDTCANYKRI